LYNSPPLAGAGDHRANTRSSVHGGIDIGEVGPDRFSETRFAIGNS
jgi:hypothetical protein